MRYLVFDFETTGVGKDAANGYQPYPSELMPLPRTDYPIELAAALVEDGVVTARLHTLVRGARRLDPWVQRHCAHLSVERCEAEGVDFMEALAQLAALAARDPARPCTLVAHNLQYDWDEVIVRTVRERQATDDAAFATLRACAQHRTCVNERTRADRSAYFFQRIGKWIGPKLEVLARKHGVPFDASAAHDAAYDVEVTTRCLLATLAAPAAPPASPHASPHASSRPPTPMRTPTPTPAASCAASPREPSSRVHLRVRDAKVGLEGVAVALARRAVGRARALGGRAHPVHDDGAQRLHASRHRPIR